MIRSLLFTHPGCSPVVSRGAWKFLKHIWFHPNLSWPSLLSLAWGLLLHSSLQALQGWSPGQQPWQDLLPEASATSLLPTRFSVPVPAATLLFRRRIFSSGISYSRPSLTPHRLQTHAWALQHNSQASSNSAGLPAMRCGSDYQSLLLPQRTTSCSPWMLFSRCPFLYLLA